jgi:hypothetical protein
VNFTFLSGHTGISTTYLNFPPIHILDPAPELDRPNPHGSAGTPLAATFMTLMMVVLPSYEYPEGKSWLLWFVSFFLQGFFLSSFLAVCPARRERISV